MLRFFKRNKQPKEIKSDALVESTLREVKEAVNKYEASLTELGLKRTVLVGEDNRINFALLSSYLGGVPMKDFYMSKETYEIFEEKDKLIPFYLDLVQKAIDDYLAEHNKLPIIENSMDQCVNFDLLIGNHNLKEKPPFPLYISNQHDMVTHDGNWWKD